MLTHHHHGVGFDRLRVRTDRRRNNYHNEEGRQDEDRQQLEKPMRHHNTLFRISITALVLVACGSAQTPVFGKLNWSMTVAQAAEAYKGSFDMVSEKYGIGILNMDVKAAVVDVGVEALSTIRPAVNCRCSAMECGSVSQPAVCSFGTT